jgi:hypothetical protein
MEQAQAQPKFTGARSRLDEKLKKWEGTPVIIPPPEGLSPSKTVFKQPSNGIKKASRNYRKKEKEIEVAEQAEISTKDEKKDAQDQQNAGVTGKHTLRIKRKRDEEPLDLFVLEQERKKVKPLSSLVEKFAALDPNIENDLQQLKKEEKEEAKQKKIEDRKLFRLAYTITDADKIKKNLRGARKIAGQASRQKTVEELRKEEQKRKEEEDFVIDVYLRDSKPADAKDLERAAVIRLESFDEELMYDNEYDKDSDADDDEDFNAEDHPWNDYPEEESPAEVSDESEYENEGRRLSSDEDGFQPYEYSSEEERYEKYAYDEGGDISD